MQLEIRNSAESLKNLLGIDLALSPGAQQIGHEAAMPPGALSGDMTIVSSLGHEISQVAHSSDIRSEKVAAIQSAIANGTYHVSSQAIARKVVDSLLTHRTPSVTIQTPE